MVKSLNEVKDKNVYKFLEGYKVPDKIFNNGDFKKRLEESIMSEKIVFARHEETKQDFHLSALMAGSQVNRKKKFTYGINFENRIKKCRSKNKMASKSRKRNRK